MTTLDLVPNALKILETRYLRNEETPEDMFRRVAKHVALAEDPSDREEWEERFYSLMSKTLFLPNSPTMFNAGTGQGSLSACFVLVPDDTMDSIMQVLTDSAMIQKWGGGVGYAFSKLRTVNTPISSTHGKACGAVSVISMYSHLSDMITQGGKRHGANMGMLNVAHPELMSFIKMKNDDESIQNFNISVLVNDDFMNCVKAGSSWNLVDSNSKAIVETLNAKDVWSTIIESAWSTGDPGLGFIDRVNEVRPNPGLGLLEASNPCGEQYLENYGSCNLGSIDVSKFLANDGEVDWPLLKETIYLATRFLDDVVEVNEFPVQRLFEVNRQTRRIGLGIMGFADLLIKMGIPYDSDQALHFGSTLMKFIKDSAIESSQELAVRRGPFELFEESIWRNGPPMRNSAVTTIAPTGTISAIAGCWGAIEPFFAMAFKKNVLDGQQLYEFNPHLEKALDVEGIHLSEDMRDEIVGSGSIATINDIPERIRKLFKVANEISADRHVRMQAAFQSEVDNSVSKTINMAESATYEDVERAYLLADQLKCKGITIYRDGSKSMQVFESINSNEKGHRPGEIPEMWGPGGQDRPKVLTGITEKISTGHGNAYITLNFAGKDLFEVFTNTGKAGGCDSAQIEAISRLASTALRFGVPAEEIARQLKGITCCPVWDNGSQVRSTPDAIALAINRSMGIQVEDHIHSNGVGNVQGLPNMCPDCSSDLIMQEGCSRCPACGYANCG